MFLFFGKYKTFWILTTGSHWRTRRGAGCGEDSEIEDRQAENGDVKRTGWVERKTGREWWCNYCSGSINIMLKQTKENFMFYCKTLRWVYTVFNF